LQKFKRQWNKKYPNGVEIVLFEAVKDLEKSKLRKALVKLINKSRKEQERSHERERIERSR